MSVSVYIDGQPAKRSAAYLEVIGNLGAVPDESQKRFEVWTSQPSAPVTSRSVWLARSTDSGHLCGNESTDVLLRREHSGLMYFSLPRIRTINDHGTGCVLATPIASGLAKGLELREANRYRARFCTRCVGSIYSIAKWCGTRLNGFTPEQRASRRTC